RLSGRRNVVVTERVRLIRVVEDGQPPRVLRRLVALADEQQVGAASPQRAEIFRHLLLQGGRHGLDVLVAHDGAVIDDRNWRPDSLLLMTAERWTDVRRVTPAAVAPSIRFG